MKSSVTGRPHAPSVGASSILPKFTPRPIAAAGATALADATGAASVGSGGGGAETVRGPPFIGWGHGAKQRANKPVRADEKERRHRYPDQCRVDPRRARTFGAVDHRAVHAVIQRDLPVQRVEAGEANRHRRR